MNRGDQIRKCLELSCGFARDLLETRARAGAASWVLTQAGGRGREGAVGHWRLAEQMSH